MSDMVRTLLIHLERGEAVVAATILTREGSAPRAAGSRMLLAADGPGVRICAGTVGGGLVEARVMAQAAEVLASGERRVERFDLTGELAAGADMICGGNLRIFLERIAPEDLPLFRCLDESLARGQGCLRLTPLGQGRAALLPHGDDGGSAGAAVSPDLARAARRAGAGIAAPVVFEHCGQSFALEPWTAASPLLLFGAGHVARATAQVAALAGFCVTVLDDRPEFANAGRFPQASPRVLASFEGCFQGLPDDPGTFVVIVTRGHQHDADVLAQALRTRAGYIGMIGSRRKRDAVYERLRAQDLGQGFTEADLARVHCPVGLDIGAETPEEIAVSIVAELIQVRASRPGSGGRSPF